MVPLQHKQLAWLKQNILPFEFGVFYCVLVARNYGQDGFLEFLPIDSPRVEFVTFVVEEVVLVNYGYSFSFFGVLGHPHSVFVCREHVVN